MDNYEYKIEVHGKIETNTILNGYRIIVQQMWYPALDAVITEFHVQSKDWFGRFRKWVK